MNSASGMDFTVDDWDGGVGSGSVGMRSFFERSVVLNLIYNNRSSGQQRCGTVER